MGKYLRFHYTKISTFYLFPFEIKIDAFALSIISFQNSINCLKAFHLINLLEKEEFSREFTGNSHTQTS